MVSTHILLIPLHSLNGLTHGLTSFFAWHTVLNLIRALIKTIRLVHEEFDALEILVQLASPKELSFIKFWSFEGIINVIADFDLLHVLLCSLNFKRHPKNVTNPNRTHSLSLAPHPCFFPNSLAFLDLRIDPGIGCSLNPTCVWLGERPVKGIVIIIDSQPVTVSFCPYCTCFGNLRLRCGVSFEHLCSDDSSAMHRLLLEAILIFRDDLSHEVELLAGQSS